MSSNNEFAGRIVASFIHSILVTHVAQRMWKVCFHFVQKFRFGIFFISLKPEQCGLMRWFSKVNCVLLFSWFQRLRKQLITVVIFTNENEDALEHKNSRNSPEILNLIDIWNPKGTSGKSLKNSEIDHFAARLDTPAQTAAPTVRMNVILSFQVDREIDAWWVLLSQLKLVRFFNARNRFFVGFQGWTT